MSTTAPITRDNFTFANGDLFASISGNFHRRCSIAELKSHFDAGSEKEYPVHWFSAQLIHYGLKPSTTKAVSRMRLYDAVSGNQLVVPAAITALEKDMRKEWNKNDREAKKVNKTGTLLKTSTTQTTGKITNKSSANKSQTSTPLKRKAVESMSAQLPQAKRTKKIPAAKSPQTVRTTTTTTNITKNVTKTTTNSKKIIKNTTKANPNATSPPARTTTATIKTSAKKSTAPPSESSSSSRPKLYARCSRGGIAASRGRGGISVSRPGHIEEASSQKKHIARRGAGRGRGREHDGRAYTSNQAIKDEPGGYKKERCALYNSLNSCQGTYELQSNEVADNWGDMYGSDFEMELTFDGSHGWGRFDLGVITGVLQFDTSPDSQGQLHFKWRGRENEGPIIYGDSNEGWLQLSSDGYISGCFDYMRIDFSGHKVGLAEDVSDASRAPFEWENEYSERQYEYERVSRW